MTVERYRLTAVLLLAAAPALAAQEPGVPRISLDEAISLAVSVHPSMVQARGSIRSASAGKREALGSWLPSVNGSSNLSTNSSTRFDPNTQRNVQAASTSYSAGLSASLEIFDGFRRSAEMRAAGADLDNAEASLVSTQFEVVLQTKQAFFQALAADDLVRVSEVRIQRAQEQLNVSREKLAAGNAIRSDTLRASVELANARLQLLQAETQRANAEATLARLIGIDGLVRAAPDSSLFEVTPLDTASLRAEALASSPGIAVAEASARTAAAQRSVARAQYFPSLNASYSTNWSGTEPTALTGSWSARLALSWPLFNGFSRESNQARSAVAEEAAWARAEDARRQVNQQMTQQLAALTSAQLSLEIAEANILVAEEDLRVQQERYRLGVATIVDVLTSQVSLDQAAVDAVQARLDLLTSRAQIEALIGREL